MLQQAHQQQPTLLKNLRLPYIELTELNGATMCPAHCSDQSCAVTVEHITKEMKCLTLDSCFSIALDESSVHGHSHIMTGDVTGNDM